MLFQIIKYSVNTNVKGNTSNESNSGKARNACNASNASDAGYARDASNATMQIMHSIEVMDNDNHRYSMIINDNQ